MTDEDVRDMLAERARAIRPSPDGLAKIEARLAGTPATTRRRFPMPMLAAAAVTVLALVGVTVFVQRDDETSVDSGTFTTAPTTEDELQAVWPSNDRDVLEGISGAWAQDASPNDAVRLYLEDRVGRLPGDDDLSTRQLDDGVVVTVTGDFDTEVHLRRLDGDGPWYVTSASSGSVSFERITYDGEALETIAVTTADGDIEVTAQGANHTATTSSSSGAIVAGEPFEKTAIFGGTDIERDEPLTVHAVLRTGDFIAVVDRFVEPPRIGTTPATASLPAGVWPFPQDDVGPDVLDDPVETARAYVDARAGGVTDRTTVSEYREGDASSGEVVFGGDIQTTVFVRRLDGRWHVEGSASDLVTLHDADGDGALTAVVEAKGWLQSHVTLSSGSTEPLVPAREFDAGEEITEGLAYDLNTDQVVKAVRFLLTFGPEGVKGLSEVAFRPPFAESTVPADALLDEGGLDAVETAQRYLADRLGGRTVTITGSDLGQDEGEVTWEAGVVRLQRADGYWYVVEAIGDSVQINAVYFEDGAIRGELAVAERGTLHVSTADGTVDISVDQDGEGTLVPFELETAVSSGPVRVVFETATGFVSLAERVYG